LLAIKFYKAVKLKNSSGLEQGRLLEHPPEGNFLKIGDILPRRDTTVIFLGPIPVTRELLESGGWSLILPVWGTRKKKVELLENLPNRNMWGCE